MSDRITYIRKDLYDYRGFMLKRTGEFAWSITDATGAVVAFNVPDMADAYQIVDSRIDGNTPRVES